MAIIVSTYVQSIAEYMRFKLRKLVVQYHVRHKLALKYVLSANGYAALLKFNLVEMAIFKDKMYYSVSPKIKSKLSTTNFSV